MQLCPCVRLQEVSHILTKSSAEEFVAFMTILILD